MRYNHRRASSRGETRFNNYLVLRARQRDPRDAFHPSNFLSALGGRSFALKFLASFPRRHLCTLYPIYTPALFHRQAPSVFPWLSLPTFLIFLSYFAILVPSLSPAIVVSCESPLVRTALSPSPQRASYRTERAAAAQQIDIKCRGWSPCIFLY